MEGKKKLQKKDKEHGKFVCTQMKIESETCAMNLSRFVELRARGRKCFHARKQYLYVRTFM